MGPGGGRAIHFISVSHAYLVYKPLLAVGQTLQAPAEPPVRSQQDDVRLVDGFSEKLEKLMNELPKDWEALGSSGIFASRWRFHSDSSRTCRRDVIVFPCNWVYFRTTMGDYTCRA